MIGKSMKRIVSNVGGRIFLMILRVVGGSL